MIRPEERNQLITTYCATFKGMADSIAQRCEVLLADDNDLFSDEQKTVIKYMRTAIQKFLSGVETARQFAVTQGWGSWEPGKFEESMAIWIHDLRTPLGSVIEYTHFLERGLGPLNTKQQEAIEYVYQLVQGLLPTITELSMSSTQA